MSVLEPRVGDQAEDLGRVEAEPLSPGHNTFLMGSLLLAASAVFLYFLLFTPSGTPFCFAEDGAIYLMEARRMLAGGVIYRDFLEFVTPGTPQVCLVLVKIFGPKTWLANFEVMFLGLALVGLTFRVASRLMSGGKALLAGALLLAVPYSRGLDPTHHLYSVVIVMGALAVLLEKRTSARLIVGGGLCGVACCFTQSRGALAAAGVALFLLWEDRRQKRSFATSLKRQAWFWGGVAAPVFPVLGWYAWKAGIARLFYCLVIYPAKYFSQDTPHNSWEALSAQFRPVPPWQNLGPLSQLVLVYALIPWIYILCFFRYRLRPRQESPEYWASVLLVATVGLSMFVAVASAPDMRRLSWSSAPAIILLGWFLNSQRSIDKMFYRLLWAGTIAAALLGVGTRQLHRRGILNTVQGASAVVAPETYQELQWLHDRTDPSQNTFQVYAPARPPTYYYLGMQNPTDVAYMTNTGYTRPEQVDDAIRKLEKYKVQYVVWDTLWLDDAKPRVKQSSDSLGPLRRYIMSHYRVVKSFDGVFDIVWERYR